MQDSNLRRVSPTAYEAVPVDHLGNPAEMVEAPTQLALGANLTKGTLIELVVMAGIEPATQGL